MTQVRWQWEWKSVVRWRQSRCRYWRTANVELVGAFRVWAELRELGPGWWATVFSLGVRGLGSGMCTLCAWSALSWWRVPCIGKWSQPFSSSNVSTLGRRRVPCFVKWSLPPSGKVKLSVAGCFIQWQHNGKAVSMRIMLSCNRVADQVIFPSCHRCVTYVKANRVASGAFFVSWMFSSCVLQ
ncbi:hypothetical protein RchiOBHm_Chr2g0150711 [Rosa chinensis]|uniref:Uncharacterized protein n=1 Tax=Rosa chinensis TaxID=74649 RepID=A0A2P6S016_ROSCH|nr:hypothetical protein RchiOBHm_Chr2g0150711 [Rosa chinensis]